MESTIFLPTIPLLTFSKTLKHPLHRRRRSSFIHSSFRTFQNLPEPHQNRFLESLPRKALRNPPIFSNPWRTLASISSSGALSGSGSRDGGGGGGGGGGGDGGGGGGSEKEVAVGIEEGATSDADVIVLDVGGMSCGGCAASVKRILESQPQVSSASVNLATETAVVWAVPEATSRQDWQQYLGERLANHLTTCGFKSNLRDSARESLYKVFERKTDEKLQRLKESDEQLTGIQGDLPDGI